ncbi:MAG: hypothetical protein Phog2KO_25440 [Phototrophicaceae bacterium]
MQFELDGQKQDFIPIKTFRADYDLADDFSVRLFEPKDFTGLAVMDKASSALQDLRTALLDAIPDTLTIVDILHNIDSLRELFRAGLHGSNHLIGLKPEEVEFAVSGFGDVLMNWAYALIQARANADFDRVYHDWLQNSLRVSSSEHTYTYQDATWRIHILNHAYGRFGLLVKMGSGDVYILDTIYSCPAQGYMQTLLREIGQKIAERFA